MKTISVNTQTTAMGMNNAFVKFTVKGVLPKEPWPVTVRFPSLRVLEEGDLAGSADESGESSQLLELILWSAAGTTLIQPTLLIAADGFSVLETWSIAQDGSSIPHRRFCSLMSVN